MDINEPCYTLLIIVNSISIYSINMFVKLAVLACVAVASAQHWAGAPQAAQYPAGVSAHDCPNYPHCGAPAAAPAWNGGHNQWNGGNNGQWNGGQDGSWNGNNPAESGTYTGDGDYHGEGLQEAGAFGDVSQNWNDNNGQWNGDNNGQWNGGHNQWNGGNNGQWNGGNNGQWNGAQAGAWNGAQAGAWNGGHQAAPAALPAGVDAHSCPNYPYCH